MTHEKLDTLPEMAKTLIVVACHSVTRNVNLDKADVNDETWALLDYQQERDMPQGMAKHILDGINIAEKFPNSTLIFSGGQTRKDAGPKSEAYSYYAVADEFDFYGAKGVKERTHIEEFARDSFENLLFSICRFKEVTKSYPEQIIVISFSFKQYRFEELHRAALRFPSKSFVYIPSDPEGAELEDSKFDLKKFEYFERERSVKPFESDPYGNFSKVLQQKRIERDPFYRTIPYPYSCPELKDLLEWKGPKPFAQALPWKSV